MDLAVWRDISMMWLFLLTLVALAPWGALLFFAVKGMHRLRQLTKQYLPVAQDKARLLAGSTDRLCRRAAEPVIATHTFAARMGGLRRATFRRREA